MTPTEYIREVVRTAPIDYLHMGGAINPEIFHAWLGVTTECGESGDQIKKALIYGKPIDKVNLDEEFGDKLWYIGLYCHARGITFEQLFEQNIAKLRKRFPEKFTEHNALNRDLVAERIILEQHSGE